MARSMTGFGRASLSIDGRELSIELKAVNHRNLDIAFRFPRSLSFLENPARKILASRLARGHIDVFGVYRNVREDSKTVSLDTALLASYMNLAKKASEDYGIANDLTLSNVLRLPDIVVVTEAEEDREALVELMEKTLNLACDKLISMRQLEGDRIKLDLIARLDCLANIRDKIEERAPFVSEEYRTKLNKRIESLLCEVEIDRARLATEVALFADKVSIDEELVRLTSHIDASRELFESSDPIGRNLDFIVQEMNREFNTIGSKANDKLISGLVIDGKAELEKIREQVQNFE